MYMMINIVLSMLFMNVCPAVDQVEELGFSWFPAGRYSHISHVDLDALKKEEAWKVYSDHYEFAARDRGLLNLPESFGDYIRVTIATTLRLSIDKEWLKSLDEKTIASLNSEMSDLFVYQFDYLDDLVSEAAASGEIEDTGLRYQGLKIYSYRGRGAGGGNERIYGAATGLGEWLAAADINQVKILLASGFGTHPNILMNENIDEVLDVLEDAGQKWSLSMHGEERAIQMEALRQLEKNQDVIDYMIETNKKLPIYSVRETLLDEWQITETYIFVFEDEEYVRSMKDVLSAGYEGQGELEKKSSEYKNSKSVETTEGNKVIVSYVLDEEMMRLENEAAKEWDEMMKKEQEEREKEGRKKPPQKQ